MTLLTLFPARLNTSGFHFRRYSSALSATGNFRLSRFARPFDFLPEDSNAHVSTHLSMVAYMHTRVHEHSWIRTHACTLMHTCACIHTPAGRCTHAIPIALMSHVLIQTLRTVKAISSHQFKGRSCERMSCSQVTVRTRCTSITSLALNHFKFSIVWQQLDACLVRIS